MMSLSGSIFFSLLLSSWFLESTAVQDEMRTDVSCGYHSAPNCSQCPQGHGASWCNGECTWYNKKCILQSDKPGNCYNDYPRLLDEHLVNSDKMVPNLCKGICGAKQYKFAGVQNHNECWCGNSPPPANKKINSNECDRACKGDKKLMCGGGYKMNIFKANDYKKMIKKYRREYLRLKNDAEGAKEYSKSVKVLLPILLHADELEQNQIGIAYAVTHQTKYPLALLTGPDIITSRLQQQTIIINGTVSKTVGKRTYDSAKIRPTGLYAKPGDIITVTIPQDLVGKLNAQIGQDSEGGMFIEFPLKKSTQKIASPWGGLIIMELKDTDATSKKGQFAVQIGNAIKAPIFVYKKDTNVKWNNIIKKNAAPWTVLIIPGQIQIYMQTEHAKTATDMEGVLNGWKKTMDILDDLMGIPLNIHPGEEQLYLDPFVGGGLRFTVCGGGGKSAIGAYYEGILNDNSAVTYHELGHGYCYSELPDMGAQWTAEIVREYVERKKKLPMVSRESKLDTPFNVLYRMVSFSKFSNGKTCGTVKFYQKSYPTSDYDNCWAYLYRLPIWEFGWDVLKEVLSSVSQLPASIKSKTDRMAFLYCKATRSNLIPLFKFYNIEVSRSIAAKCEQKNMPKMITEYINIANCIKNENIMKCTELPGFPDHKGLCTINGVCNRSPDTNTTVRMINEFDLWGATHDATYKSGMRSTSQVKENCLGRAKEMFNWCGNAEDQPITTTFATSDEDFKFTFNGALGNCYNDWPRLLSKHLVNSDKMVPNLCKGKCGAKQYKFAGVQNYNECWCGNSPPPANKKINPNECDRACKGDKKLMCGGGYKMNIFKANDV